MNKRFKTKEEFIAEYGSNWRDVVSYGFPEGMDYLLGTVYNPNKYYGHSFSTDMFTYVTPDVYKPSAKPHRDFTMQLMGNVLTYISHETKEKAAIEYFSSPTDNCQVQAFRVNNLFDVERRRNVLSTFFDEAKSRLGLKYQALLETDIKHKPLIEEFKPQALFEMGDRLVTLIKL